MTERPLQLEISYDDGATWKPMPRGWQQSGRIYSGPGDTAIQSIGRGGTIRYRIVDGDDCGEQYAAEGRSISDL